MSLVLHRQAPVGDRPRAVPAPRPGRGDLAVLPARPVDRRGPHPPDAARARVEQVAAEEGLEYALAEGISGNTSLAHELLHHAAEHGRQGELKERLLFAHFTEARSVFDVDSLVALAAEVGLDADEARAALTDRRHRTAVRQDAATAQALGATGVPFFVVDRKYGAAGAQPADLLLQILERAWAESHPLVTVPPADGCTDDTCAV